MKKLTMIARLLLSGKLVELAVMEIWYLLQDFILLIWAATVIRFLRFIFRPRNWDSAMREAHEKREEAAETIVKATETAPEPAAPKKRRRGGLGTVPRTSPATG